MIVVKAMPVTTKSEGQHSHNGAATEQRTR